MTAPVTVASFSSHSAMVVLKGSSLLRRGRCCGALRRRIQVFPDGVPAQVEMALDFAGGPVLGPVEAMQVVDLFGREHGAIPFIQRKSKGCQDVIVGKMLQLPAAQPDLYHGNALSHRLSFCWQDREASVSDSGCVAARLALDDVRITFTAARQYSGLRFRHLRELS